LQVISQFLVFLWFLAVISDAYFYFWSSHVKAGLLVGFCCICPFVFVFTPL
jgi:hypothetical protein